MATPERVLAVVVATICAISIMALFGAFFIPSFDASKTVLVGTILGALVPLAATFAGITWAKNIDKKRENGNGGPK